MRKIFILLSFVYTAAYVSAQNWNVSEDTLYYKGGVIIGDSTGSENSGLTIISDYNTYGGGGYGIISKHTTESNYLSLKARSRVGYSSLWGSQAQGACFAGELKLKKDNANQYDSHSGAGYFTMNFDNYEPYSNSSANTHFLGGSYNNIKGTITSYPQNSAIAAVIGNDQINSDKTFAGYFLGKGYFSGKVGIGTDAPEAKLEISDGDIYISDIEKGIIMKSPDGQCWRGTLDNSGMLGFVSVGCPGVDTSAVELIDQIGNDGVSIFPNPSDALISVKLSDNLGSNVKYSVYNVSGQLVDNGHIRSNLYTLDISSLTKGQYIMNVIDKKGNKLASEIFIKQ